MVMIVAAIAVATTFVKDYSSEAELAAAETPAPAAEITTVDILPE
jgi:hypothetical protein